MDNKKRKARWEKAELKKEERLRQRDFALLNRVGYFITYNKRFDAWIEKFKDCQPLILFSMWEGYLDERPDNKAVNHRWSNFIKKYRNRKYGETDMVQFLHTSGHATAELLAKVIEKVNPQEEIIPIHTEHREKFLELDISDELKMKIRKENQ